MINIIAQTSNSTGDKKQIDWLLFAVLFCAFALNGTMLTMVALGVPSKILSYQTLIQGAVYVVTCIYTIFRRQIPIGWILGCLLYIAVLLMSWIIHEENAPYILELMKKLIISILPISLSIIYCANSAKYLSYLRVVSYFALVRVVMTPFGFFEEELDIAISSMGMAYGTITSWAVITYFAFRDHHVIDILISIFAALVYIIFGTRGAILCVCGFILFEISQIRKRKIKYTFILCAITFTISIAAFYYRILDFLSHFIARLVLYSGVLRKVTAYGLRFDNGRNEIWKRLWEHVGQNPLLGTGIGSDRAFFHDRGLYAHNLFLELFVDFGLFFGLLIIALLIIVLIRCLFSNYLDEKSRYLFAVFSVPGFCMLQVSDSIYSTYMIFAALTVALVSVMQKQLSCLERGTIREGCTYRL